MIRVYRYAESATIQDGLVKKSNVTSTRWFPKCEFSANMTCFSDNVFVDFDQQSEQFSGHDQSYIQLSPGAFRGRFLSGFLGPDVSIHMEYCNQALEQEVGGPLDHFSFGIVLNTDRQLRINGRPFGYQDLFLMTPGSHLHVFSPADCVVLAVTIRRRILLKQMALSAQVGDWISCLSGQVGFLRAQALAGRLRDDCISALESATRLEGEKDRAFLGQALVSSVAAQLSLQWAGADPAFGCAKERAYTRFQHCRTQLAQGLVCFGDSAGLPDVLKASKRSVEQAFSENVSMGPLTYLRIVRLHEVRRELANPVNAHMSIGDIAAQYGFWDWSRFSGYFRRHFDMLPSQARRARSERYI
ncbi:MAG: helix-turn-helix domain-containing protein [Rhodobacteraceae bacterium]|nr:helix-turn-helix domain-containing protein [Paracoccaceae bacterium]